MPSTPAAQRVAEQAIRLLKASADERYRAGASAYFKAYEDVRFYGVSTPKTKRIERDLFQTIRAAWTVKEAVACCDILIRQPQLEAKLVGILLLARFKKQYEAGMLPKIKSWLEKGHCNNWATTDALCGYVFGFLLVKHPGLIGRVAKWTEAKHLYVRRSAAVAMLPVIRTGEYLDEAYAIAASLLDQPEDLIHKATGWMLREAGKRDAARLESFLIAHGPRIPRTALRYAIERFPDAKRKKILAQTKAA